MMVKASGDAHTVREVDEQEEESAEEEEPGEEELDDRAARDVGDEAAPKKEGGHATDGGHGAEHHGAYKGSLMSWLTTTNHKEIGILYITTGMIFFGAGGILAMLMRWQLMVPNNTFLGQQQFNAAFTLHGTTMIFLFAMPVIFGFANYVVPLQIGARDLAFPRLNALSYWLLPTGGCMIYMGFLFPAGPADVGWTGYAPYSAYSTIEPGVDLWVMGQILLGISSTLTAANFMVMIIQMRAPGVKFLRMPLFTWSILITVFLLLLAIPVLTVGLVMLFMDRNLGTLFFADSVIGGGRSDPLLWQHVFWFFGHPEVYIVILPAFGVASDVISTFSKRAIYGYKSMVYAIASIGLLSYVVYGHHMFTTGMDERLRFFMMLTTMLVAVPTGIKVFNWLGTLVKGQITYRVPMLFALGFVAMFTIGGFSGMFLGSVPIDLHYQETYFVVAHIHYVLFGGTAMGFFAAIYYWFPKMTGRMYNEKLGLAHFLLTIIFFNLTFWPMHELGNLGMPRRISVWMPGNGWEELNYMATIGALLLGISQSLLAINVLWYRKHGEPVGDDPWGGWSLEWVTSSPPPEESFVRIPTLAVAPPPEADDDEPIAVPSPTGAKAGRPARLVGSLVTDLAGVRATRRRRRIG